MLSTTTDPLGGNFRAQDSGKRILRQGKAFGPLSHQTCSTDTALGTWTLCWSEDLPRNPTRKLTREDDCCVGRAEGLTRIRRLKPCPCSMVTWDSLFEAAPTHDPRASFSGEHLGCSYDKPGWYLSPNKRLCLYSQTDTWPKWNEHRKL